MTTLERLAERMKSAPQLTIGGTGFHYDLQELDETYRAKAERELRETPELVQESFTALCALLAEEENLYVPLELDYLQKFLRPCKWYPKSALKLMKNYFEFRQKYPQYYKNLKPSNEQKILKAGLVKLLAKRTADGSRIIMMNVGKVWKPKEITLNQIFRAVLMCIEITTAEGISQVSGNRVLIDVSNLSLSQVTYFTPSFAMAVVDYVQRCMPYRLRGIHIVNNSFIFDMVFAFFKPFLRGKVRDRILFHGSDRASLLKHFDADSLPTKYGGNYEYDHTKVGESFYNYALCFEDYFDEINQFGYPEKI